MIESRNDAPADNTHVNVASDDWYLTRNHYVVSQPSSGVNTIFCTVDVYDVKNSVNQGEECNMHIMTITADSE
jgi:hypothetical protein